MTRQLSTAVIPTQPFHTSAKVVIMNWSLKGRFYQTKCMKHKNQKGFTLIELLIVIAIIAILSVVVILSLNPVELLRQARDSNRISDMATLRSAISLYLVDVSSTAIGTSTVCYISLATTTFATISSTNATWSAPTTAQCTNWMVTAASVVATSSRGITSMPGSGALTGWLPINFSAISSGSPIGQEPIDSINSGGTSGCSGLNSSVTISNCSLFYSYIMSGSNYKLAAFMESAKFAEGGGSAVTSNDGGLNSYVYEAGTTISSL